MKRPLLTILVFVLAFIPAMCGVYQAAAEAAAIPGCYDGKLTQPQEFFMSLVTGTPYSGAGL